METAMGTRNAVEIAAVQQAFMEVAFYLQSLSALYVHTQK